MALPSRRTFLLTVLAAAVSSFLPRFLLGRRNPRSFWFLNTATGESWAVDDPVAWALANARQPILERASEGLRKLTPADDQRIIRLVTRRCKLNLIELRPGRVVVHYWGQQGCGNLHPFCKKRGLAKRGVRVTLIDRKRETTTVQTSDAFLYGERLAKGFPLGVYREKWRRRAGKERDDWTAAPHAWSSYCWEGVEQRCIPWRVLKTLWQNENAPLCKNCDRPTLVTTFGMFVAGFYKLEPKVVRICLLCKSSFHEGTSWGGSTWMQANLDKPLLPIAQIMFGHPVKYTLPWTAEGRAHERNLRLVDCLNEIDGRGWFFADTCGHVGWLGNRGTVTLPRFDGSVEGMEEWCHRIIRLLPDEV
jgi:hypothetical protein